MKTHLTKRLCALVVSLLMVMSILPMSGIAFAENVKAVEDVPVAFKETMQDVDYSTVLEPNTAATVTLGGEDGGVLISDPRNAYAVGFTINATAGTTMEIKLVREGELPSVDTYIYLYDQDFNVVASNDDYTGSGGLSKFELRIEEDATYKLLVCGYRASSLGTFSVQHNILDLHYPDEIDYSTPLALGDELEVTLGEGTSQFIRFPGSWRNRDAWAVGFNLYLNENQYVRLYSPTPAEEVDAYFYVMDEEYNVLEEGDNECEYYAEAEGTYYIAVCGFDAEQVGTLTLQVQAQTFVTGITCDPTEVTLQVGRNAVLEYVVSPEDATVKDVLFATADSTVATVNNDGRITASAVGETDVTVTTVDGEFSATCHVTVVDAEPLESGTDNLYGFVFNSDSYSSNYGPGWISFNPADMTQVETYISGSDFSMLCGEYYNGLVYAFDAMGGFYTFDTATLLPTLVSTVTLPNASSGYSRGMAMCMDYTTGTMYAVAGDTGWLYTVDITTGVVSEYMPLDMAIYGLACSTDGHLYGVSNSADIYEINKDTGECVVKVETDYPIPFYSPFQTLGFDHKNGQLYWSYFYGNNRYIFKVDPINGTIEDLGALADAEEGGSYVFYCLFAIPSDEIIPVLTHVDGIEIVDNGDEVFVGWDKQFTAAISPVNASDIRVTWESSDEAIATVDARGNVHGVAEGMIFLTATSIDGGYEDSIIVNVIAPPAWNSEDYLFGYNLYDPLYETTGFFATLPDSPSQYHPFESDAFDMYAGEFYNGTIYSYNSDGAFFTTDFETMTTTHVGQSNARTVMDMAYDYSNFRMLALADMGTAALYTVDLDTGFLTKLVDFVGAPTTVYTLACTTEGQVYVIGGDGNFYSVDTTSGQLTLIGATGANVRYIQSMAYDHNTDTLYWANYNDTAPRLYTVDTETGAASLIGILGGGMECTCLFTYPTNPPQQILVPVESVDFGIDTLELLENEYYVLSATVLPEGASDTRIRYESSNNDILIVTNNMVHAVGVGTATVTATSIDGNFTDTLDVTVAVRPLVADDGLLRGFIYSDGFYTGNVFVNIDPSNITEPEVFLETESTISATFCNGIVYAFTSSGYFYTMDPMSPSPVLISYLRTTPWDMTFDYTSNKLFGINQYSLVAINMETGEQTHIAGTSEKMFAIAAGEDGTLYVITENGYLNTIDKDTGELTPLFFTGLGANYAQAMTYDFSNKCLWWAQMGDSNGSLIKIDPITQTVEAFGAIGGGYQVTALMSYTYPTNTFPFGDTNRDGVTNTGDVAAILRSLVGLGDFCEQQNQIGDINGDGSTNTGDAAYLLEMVLD